MFFRCTQFLVLIILAGSAFCKAKNGDYKVIIGGTTYDPTNGESLKGKNLPATGLISVIGIHTTWTIDTATLGVYNYSLTGFPDANRLVTAPTVLFTSKVATLSGAQLAWKKIDHFEVKDSDFKIVFETSGGKLKIQSKDGPKGGIFQMEAEFLNPVEFTNLLGPSLFYFVNEFTGNINFGAGIDAVTKSQDPVNYHNMLLGKDSPQVATKVYQDGKMSKWSVASGGRLGCVIGEDATELGAVASNCTSKCQFQNRIRGSVPPSPDPVSLTPLRSELRRSTAFAHRCQAKSLSQKACRIEDKIEDDKTTKTPSKEKSKE
ncbi:hypothetical protein B0O99DRAFT_666666 [Bisporella sp. PMI_857]|nr:hypothetical protein B0O99DRAFT_666666 [Bisporella sp. PMI_857]